MCLERLMKLWKIGGWREEWMMGEVGRVGLSMDGSCLWMIGGGGKRGFSMI